MNLQNKATRTIGPEGESITEGKSSMHSGKGKEIMEEFNPKEEHSSPPMIRTQMVLAVKEWEGGWHHLYPVCG